jgi:hypothetical protein
VENRLVEKHKELRSRGVNKSEISAWEKKVQGRGGLRSAPIAIASLSNRCSKTTWNTLGRDYHQTTFFSSGGAEQSSNQSFSKMCNSEHSTDIFLSGVVPPVASSR